MLSTGDGREGRFLKSLTQVCGITTAGLGFVALLGWYLAFRLLTSLGTHLIPMAPSTALLFGLLGSALFVRAQLPKSRATHRISMVVGVLAMLVALPLFLLSSQGIYLGVEHLGFPIADTLHGLPLGHMSPVTAITFVLAGLSFLAALSSSEGRPRRARVALWGASLIIALFTTFLLAYIIGPPLFYGGGFIPPALPTSLAFLVLGISLWAFAWLQSGSVGELLQEETTRASYAFLLVFTVLALGIVTTGYLYYRNYENQHRAQIRQELGAIAKLKVSEITQWRQERLSDAAIFYRNPSFAALVGRYFHNPGDQQAQRQLYTWLQKVQAAHPYDRLRLHDTDNVVRMTVPAMGAPTSPVTPDFAKRASEALRSGAIVFEDFYRNATDHKIYLNMLVPVGATGSGKALGILAMRLDPELYLYPLLKRWPTPSRTAETLLVRREGNEVVFLNELRFQKNVALGLRYALTRTEIPAVQAVLGREGIMEGLDYRGVSVMAGLRAVPDSPWFLVARMDEAEVYAPLREKLWEVVFLIVILLLGAGAVLGLVWRNQKSRFYRERYKAAEALHQGAVRLERLNRVLAVLSDTNQAIVRIRELPELFEKACQIAVEKGNFSLAWIGLLDEATGEMQVAAQAGNAAGYLDKIRICLTDRPVDYCPIDTALRSGRYAICASLGRDRPPAPCQQTALAQGFRSNVSFPLRVSGKVRGAINLYADKPDFFDEEEIKLLDEMAMDISFAMEFAERDAERRRADEVSRVSLCFLEIVSRHKELFPLLEEFVSEIGNDTGCEAVGIRVLDDKGGIPYRAYKGFSREFYELENPLSLDSHHCMCINVITGATDPILPFYTPGGSFFINGTTRFLATVSEEEKGKTRNVCNQEGYESVALVPFRKGDRILGLIHVADHRENMLPLRTVEMLERAALQLGTALQRIEAEDQLRESEERYHSLFENALEGIFQSTPDGRFLTANPALAKMYGYRSPAELLASVTDIAGQLYVDPDKRDAYLRLLAEKGEVKGYENHLIRRDGSDFWISTSTRTVQNVAGEILYIEGIVEDITERKAAEQKLQETMDFLRQAVGTTIQVMMAAVEARDPYTAGHQRRTTDLACAIAAELGLPQEQIEGIRMAGSIHDIGKLSVPAEILSKPTQLSAIEFELIKSHAQHGSEILKDVKSPWSLARVVQQHHERLDGSGYPQGLKGEEILLDARIIAVADVVESMASHRPYRPMLGVEAALAEIEKNQGVFYDTAVVEQCLRLFQEKGFKF